MIGKVVEIGKTDVEIELTLDDNQKRNIINLHVAFDLEYTKVIGEIASINKNIAVINLYQVYQENHILWQHVE